MALFANKDPDEFVEECVTIDDSSFVTLNQSYVSLPAYLAYWNNRYASVYRYWTERKTITEQTYAQLANYYRDALQGMNKTRVTLAEVEHQIVLDVNYQQAKAKETMAESEKIRIYGVIDALRTKKDMLVSLGANMRLEMGSDPMIRDQTRIEREIKKNQG